MKYMKHVNLFGLCISCVAAFICDTPWVRALNVLCAMLNVIMWVIVNWGRVRP